MIKSKKQMFIVISVFVLIMLLGTVTYAFFNYTRTGSENTVRVGRLSFVTSQTRTINLTNVFPIDSSNVGTDTDNVGEVVITISGDTDYINGIEYLVSTEDVHIYTNEGKAIPVSLDVSVSGLGTESSTYFTARNNKDTTIYKKLGGNAVMGEQQVLVGYIKPNTTQGTAEGINGSITIKAYFDNDKIAITDTIDESETWVDGRTYITSSEWNSLSTNGVTFKIRVEANTGIWVGEPFYDVMTRSTVMDNISSTYVSANTGIDFNQISSNTNGKGIYTLSSTADDVYPIMYYRGDVDNNVLFGGFCWKIIRTTDTGGIRLIYNGNSVNSQCGNDRVLEKNQRITFPYDGLIGYTLSVGDSYEYDTSTKTFTLIGNVSQITLDSGNGNNFIGKYFCNEFQGTYNCSGLLKFYSYDSQNNNMTFVQITQDSSIILSEEDANRDNVYYNLDATSPASVGYMYGTDYLIRNERPGQSGTYPYFGTDFTYENGQYKLVNTETLSVSSGMLNTHHYTCVSTNPNATCESIRYYFAAFRADQQYFMYVTLTDGKSIEDALEEMFANEHDSLAKTMIDTWYRDNMTNYTNKLEDSTYCNSRYILGYGGWNPNGGDTSRTGYRLGFDGGSFACRQKKMPLRLVLKKVMEC